MGCVSSALCRRKPLTVFDVEMDVKHPGSTYEVEPGLRLVQIKNREAFASQNVTIAATARAESLRRG